MRLFERLHSRRLNRCTLTPVIIPSLNYHNYCYGFILIKNNNDILMNSRSFTSSKFAKKAVLPKSKKIEYNPPTFRTLYAMKNKRLRNRIILISFVSTVVFSVVCYSYIEIVKFFSFGGGAYRLRREMSQILGEHGHDQKIKQQLQQSSSKEGWLSNSLIAGGNGRKSLLTEDKRLQMVGKEKYETWQDLTEHGFPDTVQDYKIACKLRPEMMNDTLQQHLPLFDEDGNMARSVYYGKDAAYVEIALRNRAQEKLLEEERKAYEN